MKAHASSRVSMLLLLLSHLQLLQALDLLVRSLWLRCQPRRRRRRGKCDAGGKAHNCASNGMAMMTIMIADTSDGTLRCTTYDGGLRQVIFICLPLLLLSLLPVPLPLLSGCSRELKVGVIMPQPQPARQARLMA